MIIHQLFDDESCTYTYLLVDESTQEALIVDPVDTKLERDLAIIRRDNLRVRWILETHAHADHITSLAKLAELTGGKVAAPKACDIGTATWQLEDQNQITFGIQKLTALSTPGHTKGSMSFVCANNVFTGDTLLINGCGRTDFQSGSSEEIYNSITNILFKLPDETVVWPGHDYNNRKSSTIGIEKQSNTRLAGKTKQEFIQLMSELKLAKPKRIDEAVPANKLSGLRHDANEYQSRDLCPAQGYAGDISSHMAWSWVQSNQAVLIDVRTQAELEWVGFIPAAISVPWKNSPDMTLNTNFDQDIKGVYAEKKVVFLCRSGVRSIAAAKRATDLGIEAYNILDGFEGDIDSNAQRGRKGGWKTSGLPWRQN